MGRKPCCDKVGLKRGPWDTQEDQQLVNFLLHNTNQSWRIVPKLAGLKRCGKSCRLRWINYLRPDLKRGDFTQEEEDQIIQLHSTFGNKWSKIASHFPGRTDNEIKNHWNCKIKKKLKLLEGSVNSRISYDQQQLVSKVGPKEVDDIIPNISASKENDMTMTCESNVNDINGCDKLELSSSSTSTTIFLSVDHNSNSIMSSHNVDIPSGIFDDYSCLSVKNFQLRYYWRESSMELESLLSLEGFDNLEDIISL